MALKRKKGEEGFWNTFDLWYVQEPWQQEIYNYFMCGFKPGSFHCALLANDLLGAANHTHIANEWNDIVYFMKWLQEHAPSWAWGSYEAVEEWLYTSEEIRRCACEDRGWILPEDELVWKLISED